MIAVKIDNVSQARPQVGIDQADIVVAERVEGNLTRLLAIFHSHYPKRVGPVRSARNTDLRLLPMFGKPGLVFSGANRKVMKRVKKARVRQIKRSRRDHSRQPPHNVMVNLDRIAGKVNGIGKPRSFGYTFARSGKAWKNATTDKSPSIKIGHDTFGFRYRHGSYRTSWNGHSNTDGDTHKPVLTDNIVRLRVSSHKDKHTTSNVSNVAETVGSGKAIVYSAGKKLKGRWSRSKVSGPMTLKDGHGKDIPLRPGRTWILLDG